ncbi:MAG: hypothetical protein AB7J28_15835 [Hyphomonadaceae bacterium]
MTIASLYVHRPVLNGADIVRWARAMGFSQTLAPDDIHITIAYSREPMEWPAPHIDHLTIYPMSPRRVEPLGDEGAVVLHLGEVPILEQRWRALRAHGASWDYDGYQPHVTISYEGGDADLAHVIPFMGAILLGPEVFAEVNEEFAPGEISATPAA